MKKCGLEAILIMMAIAIVSSTAINRMEAAEKTGEQCSKNIAQCATLTAVISSILRKPS